MRGFKLGLGYGSGGKSDSGDGNLWNDPASSVGGGWVYNLDGSYTATNATSNVDNTVSTISAGTVIEVVYTISGHTGGLVRPRVGDTLYSTRSSNGTFTQSLALSSSSTVLRFDGIISFSATISNISFTITG